MAEFLNRLVDETLVLTGPHPIAREWSSEYCQQILPGSAEGRKPDIILVNKETPIGATFSLLQR